MIRPALAAELAQHRQPPPARRSAMSVIVDPKDPIATPDLAQHSPFLGRLKPRLPSESSIRLSRSRPEEGALPLLLGLVRQVGLPVTYR